MVTNLGSRPSIVRIFVFPILYHATCACGDQKHCLWLSCLVTFEYLTYMHEICATRLYLQNPSTRHHIQCWLLFSNNGCESRRAAEPFGTYRENRQTKTGRTLCNHKLRWLFPGSSSRLRPPTWLLSTWIRKQQPRRSQMLYGLQRQRALSYWPSQRRSSPDTRYGSRSGFVVLRRG